MATVVAVHGTFAHMGSDKSAAERSQAELQWWEAGSAFESDMRTLLEAAPGPEGPGNLEVSRFEWSGENSELARREAGKRLYGELKTLEAKGEPYCVVGHSHGGSVVNWALLESAARKDELKHLKRWITVGTPFVTLRREPLLFQRLPLLAKIAFVASLMLLLMFLVYVLIEAFQSGQRLIGSAIPTVLLVTGAMMSLPILVVHFFLKYWDGRAHVHHRRPVRERAKRYFGARWQSLTHGDDEAVQGLAFLPGAKLYFFDRAFAISSITLISVVSLPLLYVVLLSSPTLMVGIGNLLKGTLFHATPLPEVERELREIRARKIEAQQTQAPQPTATTERRAYGDLRVQRRQLDAQYTNVKAADRNLRYRARFFERGGKPCPGGVICGAGKDLRVNSGLLLHLVTDEISSAIGGDSIGARWQGVILSLLVPAIVVPIAFALLAWGLMLLIRILASLISSGAAHVLNILTNAEVKRAAFGNDTEGEIAVAAVDRPIWIETSPPRLPSGVADLVTAYSNGIATQSLAKFRRVIGQLASAEPQHTADTAITTYFTWKELVHSSYFDVPEFRKLVAQSLSRAEGFAPSAAFLADPDHAHSAQWLAEIDGSAGTKATPASVPPTEKDAGAVAAAVASTVKAEP
ncbi:MAG: hypothetical protein F9K44_07840 [Hyphomicrobiaceae bacterium]|nr:MAG: hypothetical protein F9K44_07840 [Hyphomicrobiaceae bacterium]